MHKVMLGCVATCFLFGVVEFTLVTPPQEPPTLDKYASQRLYSSDADETPPDGRQWHASAPQEPPVVYDHPDDAHDTACWGHPVTELGGFTRYCCYACEPWQEMDQATCECRPVPGRCPVCGGEGDLDSICHYGAVWRCPTCGNLFTDVKEQEETHDDT